MARPTTRSDFARRAGVSPAAITKACKGILKPACIGTRLDLDHPASIAYLKSKGKDADPPGKPSKPQKRRAEQTASRPTTTSEAGSEPPRRPRPTRKSPASPPAELERAVVTSAEIESYAYLSLEELTQRFGTAIVFRDWLDARKKISEIREKDLKNDETEGRLIERELVRTHVFGAIEASNRRLLGDAPKTIARRLYALAKSGAAVEEAEKVAREIIASQLKAVKATAVRVLRNA